VSAPNVNLRARLGTRIAIVCALLVSLTFVILFDGPAPRDDTILGVTFSPRYARYLGLDPHTVFVDMLDELDIRHVRLPLYWDEIEPTPDVFAFDDVDFYLEQSSARGVTVLLSVGYKQPRWPECYAPAWAAGLPADHLRRRILRVVEAEVVHARDNPSVAMWQPENEPFVAFGDCAGREALTSEFLRQEIDLIHRLDPRPVIVTDSGEASTWLTALQTSDVYFGLSLYRDIPMPVLGVWHFPQPAWSYTAKDRFARSVVGNHGTTFITELQAESWFAEGGLLEIHQDIHRRDFPPERVLTANLDYARRAYFPQIYLWGVEWWYWMSSRGYPEYVATARSLMRSMTAGEPASNLRT